MKKSNFAKLLSLVLVCVMLISTFSVLAFAAEPATESEIEIYSNNVLTGGTQRLMYAIKADEGAEFDLTVTDANGNEIAVSPYVLEGAESNYINVPSASKGDAMCYIFATDSGVAPQNIDEEVVATVTVDGEVVDTATYSVLEYVYNRLYVSSNASKEEKAMFNSLLTYADLADVFYNEATDADKVSTGKLVKLINCTADYEGDAVFAKGTTLTGFATDLVAGEGMVLVYEITNLANGSTTRITPEDMAANGYTVETNVSIEAVETEDVSDKEPELLAKFNLGANGTATHKDGSTDKATYTETVNGYTLSITGGSKMYPSSIDAKGNGCLKFGSGSAAGKFTLTVGDNVTEVILYVAGYKKNAAKISINGGSTQSISTLSDNGDYTAIKIDTTSNKTITFATMSGGYRAMMDAIEFIGYAD